MYLYVYNQAQLPKFGSSGPLCMQRIRLCGRKLIDHEGVPLAILHKLISPSVSCQASVQYPVFRVAWKTGSEDCTRDVNEDPRSAAPARLGPSRAALPLCMYDVPCTDAYTCTCLSTSNIR